MRGSFINRDRRNSKYRDGAVKANRFRGRNSKESSKLDKLPNPPSFISPQFRVAKKDTVRSVSQNMRSTRLDNNMTRKI
jgi:hypothetical protein